MALGDSFFENKVIAKLNSLESELELHPAFEDFKNKLLKHLESNAEALATYSPEQLISEAKSFEELVALKDFLQEKFGNEQSWWDFYHVRRRELAFSVSYYGEGQFGLPVNPRIFDRGFGRGAQSEAVQRNLFAKKFSFEQISGRKSLWSVGGGKIPVEFKVPHKFFPPTPVERFMSFDLETTGLLKDLTNKHTGRQRGIYSAGWVMDTGPEPGNFLQRILPPRAKGKWTGQEGTRPFFGHYIETEIIPRGEKVAGLLGDKIYRTESEKEIVSRFLSIASSKPKDVALLGYNIKRFDIPFMSEMAQRHGMSQAWKEVLSGRQVIDVAPMAERFLSEQLAGHYVGWQETMFSEMGLHPKGWALEAIASGLGYKTVEGLPHTPVEDAEMSAFVYRQLQDKQAAEKIWKTGGFERYQKVLAEKGTALVPLSEFENMLEVRDGEVFLKPPKMGASSLEEFNASMLSRLQAKYGASTFAKAVRADTAEATTRAVSKTTSVGLGYAFKGAKYAAGAALLGAVLPGHGISNLIGGAAAIGGWKAAGLGIAKAGISGGTPYKLLGGALGFGIVKALSLLDEPDRVIVSASGNYEGAVAEEETAANESYYMPQISGPPPESTEATPAGFNILKAYDFLGQFEKDKKLTQQETEAMAALVTVGAQNNALLQTVSAKDASNVFKSGINWRDKAHAAQITTTLQEPNQLGEFGWYDPSRKTLAVNALIDPRDMGAFLGQSHAIADKQTESKIASSGLWATSPSKMKETTLHEGLHSVWDTDIDPAHKRAFMETIRAELEAGSGPNIDALAAKHPVYAQQVERAKGNFLFGINEQSAEWVSNEIFAHRGAGVRYNVDYDMGKNSRLDAIASQYVNWGKKRQGGIPVFTGTDVDAALSAGGLTPAAYSHYASTSRLRMTPNGAGIQFSGLSEGGGAKGTRHIRTDFGSPWQGSKVTGPIAAAIAGAGILLTGAVVKYSSSDSSSLRPRTIVHGQEIDPEIMAFREEWIKNKKKRAELERRKEEAGEKNAPGDIEPWRIKNIGQGMARIDTEGLKQVWEDADTLNLKYPWYKFWKNDISIRLSGVDAPEVASHESDPLAWMRWRQEQPHGMESVEEVKKLVGDQTLDLVIASDPKQRSYGRYIGLLHRPGAEIPLNVEIIQKGIAAALPWGDSGSDIINREVLIQAEEEASSQKLGMWESSYWQRYLDIAQGARRRITFTSFTDLERLSGNLNLAAAEALMRSEDTKYEPWMGRYIGSKLRMRFPKSSSEGIHPGAPNGSPGVESIRRHSDFGTGAVRGALKRVGQWFTDKFLFKFRKAPQKDFLSKAAPEYEKLLRGIFGEDIKIQYGMVKPPKELHMEVLNPQGKRIFEFTNEFTQGKNVKSSIVDLHFISVDESFKGLAVGSRFRKGELGILQKMGMTGAQVESHVLNPVTARQQMNMYKATLEFNEDKLSGGLTGVFGRRWTGTPEYYQKAIWEKKLGTNFGDMPEAISWGRVPSPREYKGTSLGEIVKQGAVQPKKEEIRSMADIILPPSKGDPLEDFLQGFDTPGAGVRTSFVSMPPAPSGIKGSKFPAMPNASDPHLLKDGAEAPKVRDAITEFLSEFGSRWDPLRKLAVRLFEGPKIKTAEDAFEAMVASEGFKRSIRKALESKGKALGHQGETSAVKMYEAEYKGLKFNFIGKEFKDAEEIKAFFGGYGEVADAYRSGMINAEATALKELGHLRAPSFYGTSGSVGAKNMKNDVLLMEMFENAEDVGFYGEISSAEKRDLVEFLSQSHSKGIYHLDMHGENVMRVRGEGGNTEIAVIDWAMSNRLQDPLRDKWLLNPTDEFSAWKSLANGTSPEEAAKLRATIQEMTKSSNPVDAISAHIDMARAELLGKDPSFRTAIVFPEAKDATGVVVSEAQNIAELEGDAFINHLMSKNINVGNIVGRTRSVLANSQAAMKSLSSAATSATPTSMSSYNTAGAALRRWEAKHPSTPIPWKTSQNAGRRHERSMSRRSGG